MTRSISPAIAILLFSLPLEAQRGDLLGDGKVTTEGLPPELTSRDAPPAEEEVEVEEALELEMDMEMDFCGGGEETVVDVAYYALMDGEAGEAEALLVEALRTGRVAGWQRVHALLTLADAQLRLGKHWAAAHNYRRALRVSEEDAGVAARLGLATALHLQHRRRVAVEVAREAAATACASRYSEAECYAARVLVAETTRDPEERARAREAARALRASHVGLAERFDAVDRRIGLAPEAVAVAAP